MGKRIARMMNHEDTAREAATATDRIHAFRIPDSEAQPASRER
jgi:hypothetical protein